MATKNAVKLSFVFDRETKNTIRFAEKVENQLDTPQIGTVYVAKAALKALGWKQGNDLVLTLDLA